MLAYWLMLFVPALGVFSGLRLVPATRAVAWWSVGIIFTLIIGFRYHVGGDWYEYLGYLHRASLMTLPEVLTDSAPGYYLLNWISAGLGTNIYLVNLVCGAIFMSGVIIFSRRQPLPWLTFFVAVPYLVIVVGMGYTRQAVAIGFVLMGFVALSDGRMRTFAGLVLMATVFHKTAIMMLPIAALAASRRRLWNIIWVGVITLVGAYLFLLSSVDKLWTNYVTADYQSHGALIRVLMNAVPAVFYLLLNKRMSLTEEARRLWWWLSILALLCVPLVMMSSTATDRMALYLIPLQLFVLGRLPLMTSDRLLGPIIVLGVAAYYSAVLAVWLFVGDFSYTWLPYQMYPFAS